MSKTRIIGDIHGKLYDYQMMISTIDSSIQVGDFGIGFFFKSWHDKVNFLHQNTNHKFIRGNHDNPQKCKEMTGYIADGTLINDVMFIGGAWSIDYARRVEGYDWWRDEECSMEQFYQFIETYSFIKPRIMITHDAPLIASNKMFIESGKAIGGSAAKSIKTRTGQVFDSMFNDHQPDFWFYGHWHEYVKPLKIGKTVFVCVPQDSYIDVDLVDSNITMIDIQNWVDENFAKEKI